MSGMGTAVSISVKGKVTYTDNGRASEVVPVNWGGDITHRLVTSGSKTGEFKVDQGGTTIDGADNQYNPAVDVPFSWASAHTETNLDGASDGVSTSSATPSGLSDLATTDLVIGDTFMGNIGSLSMWAIELNQTQLKDVTS